MESDWVQKFSMKVRIDIEDDGKQKYNSFEARLVFPSVAVMGGSKDEVLENVKKLIDTHIAELNDLRDSIKC